MAVATVPVCVCVKAGKRVFEDRNLQTKTKILVYKAVRLCIQVLRFRSLDHQRYLRRILRIIWEVTTPTPAQMDWPRDSGG